MLPRLLVILGPTSSSKTDLALNLAKVFNGELVSADSRQVYQGLDIGTGKLPGKEVQVKKGEGYWEMDGVKVWMYDASNPKKRYDVWRYSKDAKIVIDKLIQNNKLPILVGGTGFYIKSIISGIPNLNIPVDKKLREDLEKLSLIDLQKKLEQISKKKWESLNESDKKNPRRLVRAIELVLVEKNGKEIKKQTTAKYNVLKIGLKASKKVLDLRIDERVLKRLDLGMIREVKELHRNGLSLNRMKELGLEYGLLAEYLKEKITYKELVEKLKIKIHQYAKRQMTWFKKEKGIVWFDITQEDFAKKVEKEVLDWYNMSGEQTN